MQPALRHSVIIFSLHLGVFLLNTYYCCQLASSVRQFVCERDYAKSFQNIIMKPHRIMDYWYGTNKLSFGVDPTQNGRVAAILNFCCNI